MSLGQTFWQVDFSLSGQQLQLAGIEAKPYKLPYLQYCKSTHFVEILYPKWVDYSRNQNVYRQAAFFFSLVSWGGSTYIRVNFKPTVANILTSPLAKTLVLTTVPTKTSTLFERLTLVTFLVQQFLHHLMPLVFPKLLFSFVSSEIVSFAFSLRCIPCLWHKHLPHQIVLHYILHIVSDATKAK